MACYVVTYDLLTPGQDYTNLYKRIKAAGTTWCHPLESTWFIVSTKTSKELRDFIRVELDRNDKLFIGKLTGQAAWFKLGKSNKDWLHENLN